MRLAIDQDIACGLGGLPAAVQEALKEFARMRHQHIEAWAAALLAIDPEAPEKYRLVEEMSQDGTTTRVTWRFERVF